MGPRPTSTALRRLVLPVYLPVLAVNAGVSMLVPILPLYLESLSLDYSAIGYVLAAAGLGSALSQLPVGEMLRRRSETETMVISVLVLAGSVALLGATGAALALVGLQFVWGVGSVGWLLSRQSFLTRTVDPVLRGRAMSLFGGTIRLAYLIGPLLGGWTADRFGFSTAFWATAVVTAAGLVPLLFWRPIAGEVRTNAETIEAAAAEGSLRGHRTALAVAGAGQLCVMLARQGRFVVLPLIGAAFGLDPGEVGVLVAVGSFADLVLFPVSGVLMDRFGRLFAIVPSFTLLGVGLLVLSRADGTTGVAVAAVVMGVGNGLGSGTMLTLSSDLAPVASPARFLASMGAIRDVGKIIGPIIVGSLADAAGLDASSLALAAVAGLGVVIIAFGVGETRGRAAAAAPS
ncbi:MAG: MFS transporter [Acidimicrobiales bacterium]